MSNYTRCLECDSYNAKVGFCLKHNLFFLSRPTPREMPESILTEDGRLDERQRVIGCRSVSATDVCVATVQIYINEMKRKAPTL